MNGHRRHLPGISEAARERRAGKKRADQPGPCRVSHSRERFGTRARGIEGGAHERQQSAHVVA
jgi:hypothetical protein